MMALTALPWVHKDKAKTSYEGGLYAAMDVISSGNAALAQQIHDSKRPSPFSAVLSNGTLRVGTLDTDIFLAIANSSFAHKAERLSADSFESLIDDAPDTQRIKLTFETPLALGSFGVDTAFPDARWLFGSLLHRWQSAGGPLIPDLQYGDVCCYCARLRMTKVIMSKYAQRAWKGYMGIIVPQDMAKWYHVLLRFARYSGVGRKTTHGLGQVRYE